ncbi:hypothetical protein OSB04_019562 [Centaurea solstitialis]|uniref:Uncharacterized protein n=1 Tax=Centaurea solstitialis TaxID=347529 RepID=A0AA38SQK4_9ASTR|nr:hypothetical protein OSB04_019562 [Centaurea solstitialis]
MAELLLSPLEMLFKRLASAGIEKLARYAGILFEVKNWEVSLSMIKDLLDDASEKEITDKYVKVWLTRLQHLAYDIDDVLDDLASDAMHRELAGETGAITSKVRKLLPTCCTSFSVGIRMHDKLNSITTELQAIEKDRVARSLNKITDKVVRKVPIIKNRQHETRFLGAANIIGRQGEKKAFLYKLLGDETCSQNFNIVPIVGMGGIGKTTLARLLYNETQVKDHFEIRAWVCVSNEFDIFKISNSIFQEVTKGHKISTSFGRCMSETRRDWDTLVSPFHYGAPGSKIMMTTRKEKLLKSLDYNNLNHLESLPYDDSLSLFSQHALGESNLDSHPLLKPYGEGIVKKCDGLPLALEAIGRLLKTKPSEEDWKVVLDSEIWMLKDEKEIVPALRLSYNDLDACLKKLFAYCSLFPKDYMFDKEELILLWMTEGFLHQTSAKKSTTERVGHECFEELLSRSFFQQTPNKESAFVMHDLMNDLATYVAGDFFWRMENEVETDDRMDIEKYRHIYEYVGYKKFKAFEGAKNLRTFLAMPVRVNETGYEFFISNKTLGPIDAVGNAEQIDKRQTRKDNENYET